MIIIPQFGTMTTEQGLAMLVFLGVFYILINSEYILRFLRQVRNHKRDKFEYEEMKKVTKEFIEDMKYKLLEKEKIKRSLASLCDEESIENIIKSSKIDMEILEIKRGIKNLEILI